MSRAFEFALERVAAGDADEAALPPAAASALAALRTDNARTLEHLPPATVVAEVARRRRARVVRPAHAPAALAALAAAACALAFAVLREAPAERVKGAQQSAADAPSLAVWRHEGNGAERLADGARVTRGDVVQLTYTTGGHAHGVVVALDGAGNASLVFPERIDGETTLNLAGAALDHALEIDDAPGFERFVLVVGDDQLAPRAVLDAAFALARVGRDAQDAPLAVSASAQASVVLVKEAP